MASEGPNNCIDTGDDASVGTVAWTSTGSINASDDVRATAALGGAATSHYLTAQRFQFSIPTGATIDGIQVEWEKSASVAGTVVDSSVRLIKAGTIVGTDKADAVTNWPLSASEAYVTYGGPTDLWGTTWTAAQINSLQFGACLAGVSTGAVQLRVDHVRITVYYTPAPAGNLVMRPNWGRQVDHPGYWDE